MFIHKYTLDKLKIISRGLAKDVVPPFSLLLNGEIGSGKTSFSQFFIKELLLDKSQNITSPTFNIVQIYESIKGPIWHVDLYRIKNESELFNLGLIEAVQESICIIEWPNIIRKYIKNSNFMEINLSGD